MKNVYVEIGGKSFEVKSENLRAVLKRATELPDMATPVDRKLYLVVTGEDGEAGTGGILHLVTRDRKKAVRKMRKVVNNLGFGWLKRGKNDGDGDADERYDRDGMTANVNTYGHGVSFEATVKTLSESDFERELCI